MSERQELIKEFKSAFTNSQRPAWEVYADLVIAREEKLLSDKFTYCAYCGKEFPIEDAGAKEQVLAHIRECPNHPIADYRAEIERLLAGRKAVLERVRKPLADYLNARTHFTADDKSLPFRIIEETVGEIDRALG